ncbi:MAG: ATP-binding cassette domain-containing protein, partial [Actinobacteria bacterium]|nr:ATP-binding cassette domain-containing protein [Actinomycetota bacterium]
MGYLEAAAVGHALPDGRALLHGVSFRVGEGAKTALVGANGAGKTTLLRLIAGDEPVQTGVVTSTGGLGVMRQFIGSVRDGTTVQDFLVQLSAPPLRAAWDALQASELALMDRDDEPTQLDYAHALTGWGDAGGYDAGVLWDTVTVAA